MNKPTNVADATHLAAFFEEGLNYVNLWTPTQINAGGCGAFARLLYNKLKEVGIPCEILAIYHDVTSTGHKNFLDFIRTGKNLTKAGEDHIVLKVGDIYLDSDGICNPAICISKEVISITYEQLEQLIEHGDWNDEFDKDCIPFIEKKLDEVFAKVNDFTPGCFKFPENGEVRLTKHSIAHSKAAQMSSLLDKLLS